MHYAHGAADVKEIEGKTKEIFPPQAKKMGMAVGPSLNLAISSLSSSDISIGFDLH